MSEVTISTVGEGKVYLLSGGGKCFTDIVSRFVSSERPVLDIIASEYDAKIVNAILERGHYAATEFDYYVFGVEGYSRVTEVQLVRKRLASYMIKSGRVELKGKRKYELTIPESIKDHEILVYGPEDLDVYIGDDAKLPVNPEILAKLTELWYNAGLEKGLPEEDLRYMKQQATSTKMVIGMNAHALMDWFSIRCCQRAQAEIRDLATKMFELVRKVSPDLFKRAGANCVRLGYCPEGPSQCKKYKGKIPTLAQLKDAYHGKSEEKESVPAKADPADDKTVHKVVIGGQDCYCVYRKLFTNGETYLVIATDLSDSVLRELIDRGDECIAEVLGDADRSLGLEKTIVLDFQICGFTLKHTPHSVRYFAFPNGRSPSIAVSASAELEDLYRELCPSPVIRNLLDIATYTPPFGRDYFVPRSVLVRDMYALHFDEDTLHIENRAFPFKKLSGDRLVIAIDELTDLSKYAFTKNNNLVILNYTLHGQFDIDHPFSIYKISDVVFLCPNKYKDFIAPDISWVGRGGNVYALPPHSDTPVSFRIMDETIDHLYRCIRGDDEDA